MADDDCKYLGEEITPDSSQVGGINVRLWCKRSRAERDSMGFQYNLPCFDCETGKPMCEGYIKKNLIKDGQTEERKLSDI